MTNTSLAQSYLVKARHRLKILGVLLDDGAFSDVVAAIRQRLRLLHGAHAVGARCSPRPATL